jgi:hypothetical protein
VPVCKQTYLSWTLLGNELKIELSESSNKLHLFEI